MPEFAVHTLNWFSNSGGGKTFAFYTLLLVIWLRESRQKFMYFTLLITMLALMMNTMKMLYKNNRLQWEDHDDPLTVHDHDFNCSMEHGNPSGHSMIAATLACAILFDMFDKNKNRTTPVRIAWGIGHTIVAILYIYFMGWARVVIAAHSWNQVIFGWFLGIWLAAFL